MYEIDSTLKPFALCSSPEIKGYVVTEVMGERMANSRTRHAGLRRCYSACRVQPNEIVKWEIIVISEAKWTAARGVQGICT